MDEDKRWQEELDLAIQIRKETPVPVFSETEKKILSRVFSNTDKNTYFIYGLPEELITTLLSMFSRVKNPRGLRGLFLEGFVPKMPVIGRIFTDPEGYLRENGDKAISQIPAQELEMLVGMGFSLDYYRSIVTMEKIKDFLGKFLDAYGHNSIARMGIIHLALENVSLLAEKTVEWARPGAGYIALSTRFVDMGARQVYPVWRFFQWEESCVREHILSCMEAYQRLYPICESHFRKEFGHFEPNNAAITGKVCDSLGNLLPCATLTSLGVSMMGEAYQSVLRHLIADDNPECMALAHEIVEEARKTGNAILLGSHYKPSGYFPAYYVDKNRFPDYDLGLAVDELRPEVFVQKDYIVPNALALESIIKMSGRPIDEGFLDSKNLFVDLNTKRNAKHESYEKLPDWFEHASAIFSGLMSFRSWRDIHRMGFCTHRRGWVTPQYGVYLPPDMPQEFKDEYAHLHRKERFSLFSMDSPNLVHGFYTLAQYAYMIGNFVPFIIGANLREWEFVNWQRTKWGVNEEVRKVALKAEKFLRYEYPWWKRISRADLTWEYIFARGDKAVPKKS